MPLQIERMSLDEIKTYPNNAKIHTAEQIEQIKESIRSFGFNDPIAIWHNEIVEGHGRFIAAQELGFKEIDVIRLDELSDEQRRAYMLVHNKLTMNTGFDMELLEFELENIDMDMEQFGFDEIDPFAEDDKYTEKTDIPQYEPTGEEWELSDLYNDQKTRELLKEIEKADIDEETREFLIKAAYRHTVFNYKRIADFYANASKEVQTLMENSALVIIDYDDAIKNGYTTLNMVAGEYIANET